jgi:hypothetical protein
MSNTSEVTPLGAGRLNGRARALGVAHSVAPAFAVLLLAAMGLVSALAAQAPADAQVFLAMPATFPDLDARAVVLREPGKEIVLLHPDEANPEALAMALQVLATARRSALSPGRGQMIPITGFVFPDGIAEEEQRRLGGLLAQLQRRPLSSVGNLGPGRWMRYSER